ncbi:hypothetical protein JW978_03300 [Candidatus Dojkabacteria bacterium]|nr:hypothetical protein [Candidatus Dojkabacteria bacterium]
MTTIFGVDLDKEITPINVRDAIIECFYQAHCEDSGITRGDEILTKDYCASIVKKAFDDVEGDYDNPTKKDILKTMTKLSEFSTNFRTEEEVKKNYMKISKLVEQLKDD